MCAVLRFPARWDIDPHQMEWRPNGAGDIEVRVAPDDWVEDQIAQPWCSWLLDMCWPHRAIIRLRTPLLNPSQRVYAEARRKEFEDVDLAQAFPSIALGRVYAAVDGDQPAQAFFEAAGVLDE